MDHHDLGIAVDIVIYQPVLNAIWHHAMSQFRNEVGEFLVGARPQRQGNGRFQVHVSDYIIAKGTKSSNGSITFTAETWRQLHDELAKRYPRETAVNLGWYLVHTQA